MSDGKNNYPLPVLTCALDWIAAARMPSLLGQPQTERPPELTAVEVNQFILAARNFYQTRAARPYLNQCIVAMSVAAKFYRVKRDDLLAADRDPDMTEVRQKIMAFVRVVTMASARQIGRAFNRDHSSITVACDKYADAIRRSLALPNAK
ncbi:helix-turn-helix domain-containing protein [Bradyrhizobium diazoefficiens]|uniref:helix-turn-helix domain-containing protein n=1 Tax=Bradyrhizobium diazoefficiens TaxID=1355477 RepID=UPI00272BDD78|nr:helix-turn-helix domain-containing protein [Bradyrhizobium diazoefficiens]WLA75072.1 helix-turn-helix domain-containing protein [Bradyrhizobium diazoefficiens]